jgi:hypothetical protein
MVPHSRLPLSQNEAKPDSKAAREMRVLWMVVEKELAHEEAHAG